MPWAREPSLQSDVEQSTRSAHEWAVGCEFHFTLIERESGAVLGIAGLNAGGEGVFELHYWMRSDRTRRGLTTEAGRALVGWAKAELRAKKLTLWAGRDNTASRRVAEKLGFVHVGPLNWEPEGGLGVFPAESYELTLRP